MAAAEIVQLLRETIGLDAELDRAGDRRRARSASGRPPAGLADARAYLRARR